MKAINNGGGSVKFRHGTGCDVYVTNVHEAGSREAGDAVSEELLYGFYCTCRDCRPIDILILTDRNVGNFYFYGLC